MPRATKTTGPMIGIAVLDNNETTSIYHCDCLQANIFQASVLVVVSDARQKDLSTEEERAVIVLRLGRSPLSSSSSDCGIILPICMRARDGCDGGGKSTSCAASGNWLTLC